MAIDHRSDNATYIPAVDYVRQDWKNGTLARIQPRRRNLWPFVLPIALLALLALGVMLS